MEKVKLAKLFLVMIIAFVTVSLAILAQNIFKRKKIIERQQTIIQAHVSQRGSRDKDLLALKNKDADLQAALQALKSERLSRQKKIDALQQQISAFQQEKEGFQQESFRLQQEVARLQGENQILNQKKSEAEKKLVDLQKVFLEQELQPGKAKKEEKPKPAKDKELASAQREVKDLKEQLAKLKTQNEQLQAKLSRLPELDRELVTLRNQNQTLQKTMGENIQLQTKLNQAMQEQAQLKGKLGQMPVWENEMAKLENKILALNKTIELSTQQNQELIRENNRLKETGKNAAKISEDNLNRMKALNAQLEEKAKGFFQQAQGKEQLKEQMEQLNRVVEALTKERALLNTKINGLKKEVAALQGERMSFYNELGAACTQAGLYDQAVDFYNKVLKINPDDAAAHYRLGFLYKRSNDDARMAVYHFKRYLALEPNAKNRKEVQYFIQMLLAQ